MTGRDEGDGPGRRPSVDDPAEHAEGTDDTEEGPHVTRMVVGGMELAVISLPSPHTDGLTALTASEREVAELILAGCSNRHIARERGTSERTVANQVQSIFRKLGVVSRAELAAKLSSSG